MRNIKTCPNQSESRDDYFQVFLKDKIIGFHEYFWVTTSKNQYLLFYAIFRVLQEMRLFIQHTRGINMLKNRKPLK